jgi:hypothetical protein
VLGFEGQLPISKFAFSRDEIQYFRVIRIQLQPESSLFYQQRGGDQPTSELSCQLLLSIYKTKMIDQIYKLIFVSRKRGIGELCNIF